jgi:hypothetical protein
MQTVQTLQKNKLAPESTLYIFSDGFKKEEDRTQVEEVRAFNQQITGFKEIHFINREKNIGLANSIISGVTQVIQEHGRAIILEDDLVTTPNYLSFMNQALEFYADDQNIFSIAGYTIDVKAPRDYPYDVYLVPRTSPWGWASWADRWATIDWQVSDYEEFQQNLTRQKEFNEGGSDLTGMLAKQMSSRSDSWAIRWCYQQYKNKQYTIYPTVSKVRNIGFGPGATHTIYYDRYKSALDDSNKDTFKFQKNIQPEKVFVRAYQRKYSLFRRFIGRLKHYLGLP